ncbi:MAG TPA: OmpA family protein [Candidatus Binatia bacterium]|jgi:outer membrane protein OmpA-like peptidoglycan-associated protein
MKIYSQLGAKTFVAAGALGSLLLTQGCLATRDWVKEQMDPLSSRVSANEQKVEAQIGTLTNRTNEIDGKLGQFEGRLGQYEGRLGQVDAKTDKALNALSNLRLERRFIIDMKEGANFAFNSVALPAQAQKEIDGFLSDLKGDATGADGTIFLIAGHTDNVGSEDYNYELGKKRADAVSRYLITQKKVDPLKVISVSYGESAPLQDNSSSQGRAKNRRVEILVYRDGITSAPTAAAPSSPSEPRASQQGGERLTQSQQR